jgi:allantoate deiminase
LQEAAEVVGRCRELATITEEPGRLTRPFATPAMARADELAGRWMTEAGLEVRTDAAGNLIGHLEGADPAAGTLLLGSHLDTVRDAGAFDGPLGVLVAVACAQRLRRRVSPSGKRQLPFSLDVIAFSDEEGLRFGTAYLGSRAVAGTFAPDLLELTDDDGVTVAEALRAFGAGEDDIASASRRGEKMLGYCEVHIEQGPALEQCDVPVGIVSAIAGATRAEVRFTGQAGHAGTVPMDSRRDAACAVAEWVLAVETAAREALGAVATVGSLSAQPGAPNVIPGAATATLDVRHADDDIRRRLVEDLRVRADEIAFARGCQAQWTVRLDNPAIAMDATLTAALAAALGDCGLPDVRLPSGAGHDAVALADLTGVSMLFVRCAGGVSHNPAESVSVEDVAVALDVLERFVLRLAEEPR